MIPHSREHRRAIATGLAGLLFIHLLIAVTGGLATSPLYPLIYVWTAGTVVLLAPIEAAATFGAAILVEAIFAAAGGISWLATFLPHASFIAIFSALFAALLRAEIAALRRAHSERVAEALAKVEQDAQDFRLSAPSRPAEDDIVPAERAATESIRRRVGSVRAIREALKDILELARISVDAESVTLFMLSEQGDLLRPKSSAPPEEHTAPPVSASEGALGAVLRTKTAVRLTKGKTLLGVPVLDDGRAIGVLAAYRTDGKDFSAEDERRLAAVAREALRAIESERIFVVMDGAHEELERFYKAFALLNQALDAEAVADRLLQAIDHGDFAAVTLFDEETDQHRVVRVRSPRKDHVQKLEGQSYANKEGGLVVMALKNGQTLPYVPLSRRVDGVPQQIFGAAADARLRAVKVFPMSDRGDPLGALVVGSTIEEDELSADEVRVLETIAAHAAITFANARMYRRMETMATTDALTGLANRRRFSELLDEALARAQRFTRNVSVLMADVDHFKKINDTHGHPFGDLVLQRIAGILTAEARRTDVVARYGGEEFVIVLDETDAAGAMQVAERVRERIENTVIQGEAGRVAVTISIGLATWPEHARDQRDLLAHADLALYESKRAGRNRVTLYDRARCNPAPAPDIAQREERAQR